MASERPVAVISGGSSGIGLAIARRLQGLGYQLVLLARDPARLEAAIAGLAGLPGTLCPRAIRLDVGDPAACAAAIAEIHAECGGIDWLITSAGIVEPGMFEDLPAESHRRQMDVNFFGTLNLVRPAVAAMIARRRGRITMISSGAGFVGIAGYSGYAPSKFAVRALAETLRVELAPAGIAVSVAFPPDTDTPQYAGEQAAKPEATKRITAGGGVMSADRVAAAIVAGALAGRFMLAPGLLMTLFGWMHSLYAPYFRWHQRRILARVKAETTGEDDAR